MFKITVNSLFQLSQITGLVAQTGIISIHGHSGSLNSSWEIIDIDEEEKGTQAGALWDTNFYILNVRINTINPTKLLTVGQVRLKPGEFSVLDAVKFKLFTENIVINCIKCFFQVYKH